MHVGSAPGLCKRCNAPGHLYGCCTTMTCLSCSADQTTITLNACVFTNKTWKCSQSIRVSVCRKCTLGGHSEKWCPSTTCLKCNEDSTVHQHHPCQYVIRGWECLKSKRERGCGRCGGAPHGVCQASACTHCNGVPQASDPPSHINVNSSRGQTNGGVGFRTGARV